MAELSWTEAGVVGEADLASRFGEEFPAVASTPFVLGLAEVACHRSVASLLADGEITIGSRALVEHLAPSRPGATLLATATLRAREGRRLDFDVEVYDGETLVARLEHRRAIVDRQRLLDRLG